MRASHTTGTLALDLVNSVACPACGGIDGFQNLSSARRWGRRELPGSRRRISDDDLVVVRRLRKTLRALFAATVEDERPDPREVRRLNDAAAASPTRWEARWTDSGWLAAPAVETPSALPYWRGAIGRSAVELLTGPTATQLRRCAGRSCEHYLLGRTRGQLWCSPTGCGNRARVARHYRRVKRRAPKPAPDPQR